MRCLRFCFLLLLVVLAWPWRVQAQDTGLALITSPLEGTIVAGPVTITGSASHPQFQRYDLAFGYSPNPTNTWFAIQDPATAPVSNAVLGTWDTTRLTDGLYTLRLRVYWSDQEFLEAVMGNVRVQNAVPTATAAPPDTPAPSPTAPLATPTPTVTAPVIVLPATNAPRATPTANVGSDGAGPINLAPNLDGARIQDAFLNGIRFTAACFLIMGVYAGLKALWRALWRLWR